MQGTSKYARKIAEKRGMYGRAVTGKSCCAHLRRAVEVDYRNAKRLPNSRKPRNGRKPVRFTDRRTVTYDG